MTVASEKPFKTIALKPWPARAAMLLDRAVAGLSRGDSDILITGFWRSGTTWLQEVLAQAVEAKAIFEPMSPKSSGRTIGAPWLSSAASALQEAWMPLSFSMLDAKDVRLLDSVFFGCAPSAFSLHCRTSVLESFRARSVIKLVRGAFLVPDLIERYKLYGFHIRRDPGAVVASLLDCKWSWSFKDVLFRRIFPPLDVPSALQEDIERLHRYDDKADCEKIAAYWAFAEKRLEDFRHPRFMVVGYEPLLMAGKAGFASLVEFVGGPASAQIEADRDSTVTATERLNISKAERAQSWRARLDPAMLARIDAAIVDIWPSAPVRHGAIARPEAATPAAVQAPADFAFAT